MLVFATQETRMSSSNDDRRHRPDMDPGSPYTGWIIGGLFVLAVIAATFAFLGRDTKTASIVSPDRGATSPATPPKPNTSTTGSR